MSTGDCSTRTSALLGSHSPTAAILRIAAHARWHAFSKTPCNRCWSGSQRDLVRSVRVRVVVVPSGNFSPQTLGFVMQGSILIAAPVILLVAPLVSPLVLNSSSGDGRKLVVATLIGAAAAGGAEYVLFYPLNTGWAPLMFGGSGGASGSWVAGQCCGFLRLSHLGSRADSWSRVTIACSRR